MLHENIQKQRQTLESGSRTLQPASTEIRVLPTATPEPASIADFRPAEAVPDIPPAVGAFLIASYAALLAMLAIATTGSGKSLFMIVIATFFLFMFFAVPAALLGVRHEDSRSLGLSRFMENGLDTSTGHSSGGAALVQMLVVPVALTFGVICMGIAAALIS